MEQVNETTHVVVYQHEGVLVLVIKTASLIDEGDIGDFGTELLSLVESCETGRFLLNFENVMFCSSAVCNKLWHIDHMARQRQMVYRLAMLRPDVVKTFSVAGTQEFYMVDGPNQSVEQMLKIVQTGSPRPLEG